MASKKEYPLFTVTQAQYERGDVAYPVDGYTLGRLTTISQHGPHWTGYAADGNRLTLFLQRLPASEQMPGYVSFEVTHQDKHKLNARGKRRRQK